MEKLPISVAEWLNTLYFKPLDSSQPDLARASTILVRSLHNYHRNWNVEIYRECEPGAQCSHTVRPKLGGMS